MEFQSPQKKLAVVRYGISPVFSIESTWNEPHLYQEYYCQIIRDSIKRRLVPGRTQKSVSSIVKIEIPIPFGVFKHIIIKNCCRKTVCKKRIQRTIYYVKSFSCLSPHLGTKFYKRYSNPIGDFVQINIKTLKFEMIIRKSVAEYKVINAGIRSTHSKKTVEESTSPMTYIRISFVRQLGTDTFCNLTVSDDV